MLQDFNLTQKRAELMKKMIFILLFISLTCSVCETSEVDSSQSFHFFKNTNVWLKWTYTDRSLDSFHIYCFMTTDHDKVSILLKYDEGVEIPQDGPFKGRVRFDKDALSEGTIRLYVSSLRIEDSGRYSCEVNKNEGFKRITMQITVTDKLQTTPETRTEHPTTPKTTTEPPTTPKTTTEPPTTPKTTTEPPTTPKTTTEPPTTPEATTEPPTTPETTTEAQTTPETKAEIEPEPVKRSTDRRVLIGLILGLSALVLCVFISIYFYKRKHNSRADIRGNSVDRNTNAAGHENLCLNQVDGTHQI